MNQFFAGQQSQPGFQGGKPATMQGFNAFQQLGPPQQPNQGQFSKPQSKQKDFQQKKPQIFGQGTSNQQQPFPQQPFEGNQYQKKQQPAFQKKFGQQPISNPQFGQVQQPNSNIFQGHTQNPSQYQQQSNQQIISQGGGYGGKPFSKSNKQKPYSKKVVPASLQSPMDKMEMDQQMNMMQSPLRANSQNIQSLGKNYRNQSLPKPQSQQQQQSHPQQQRQTQSLSRPVPAFLQNKPQSNFDGNSQSMNKNSLNLSRSSSLKANQSQASNQSLNSFKAPTNFSQNQSIFQQTGSNKPLNVVPTFKQLDKPLQFSASIPAVKLSHQSSSQNPLKKQNNKFPQKPYANKTKGPPQKKFTKNKGMIDDEDLGEEPQDGEEEAEYNDDEYEEEYDDYYDDEYYGEEEYYYDQQQCSLLPSIITEEEEKKEPMVKVVKKITTDQKQPLEDSKKICKNFLATGKCQFGAKCHFLHTNDPSQVHQQEKELCYFFQQGACKYGDKCQKSHDQGKILDDNTMQEYMAQAQEMLSEGKTPQEIIKMMTSNKDQQIQPPKMQPAKLQPVSTTLNKDEIAQKNKNKNLNDLFKIHHSDNQSQEQQQVPQQQEEELKVQIAPQIKPIEKKKTLQMKQLVVKPVQQKKPQLQMQEEEEKFEQNIQVDPKIIEKKRDQHMKEFMNMKNNAQQYMIPGKAELIAMCCPDEIEQRGVIEVNSASPFEIDRNGMNFDQFAIKALEKSAAGKELNAPHNIRPQQILYKTVEYIRDCIVDLDFLDPQDQIYKSRQPTFMDVYSFVRDRGRSIAKDFIILDAHDNEYYIRSLEELSRFLICSYHYGFSKVHFDNHQNMENLTKNLGALMNCYETIRQKYDEEDEYRQKMLKNEAEFKSYILLACSNDSRISGDYINGLDISIYNDFGQKLIREAIKINYSVSNKDNLRYFKFFKKTNYLFACLMLHFLNQERKKFLDQFQRGHHPTENIEFGFVKKALLFTSTDEAISFIEACGFFQFTDTHFNLGQRVSEKEYNEHFKKWKQHENPQFMDKLRGERSRSHIMKFGIDLQEQRKHEQQQLIMKQEMQKKLLEQQEQAKILKEQQRLQQIEDQKKIILAAQKKKEEDEKKLAEEKKQKEEQELQERILKEKKAEELRIMKEAEEKRRKELEEQQRKAKILSKFKVLGQKIEEKNRIEQLKKGMIQFASEYNKLLGKRKDRDYTQEFEAQIIELFEEDTVIPHDNREIVLNNLLQYQFDIFQRQKFQFSKWLNKILTGKEGLFTIKLFSSMFKIPKDQASIQFNDINASLILMFKELQTRDLSKLDQYTLYEKQVNKELTYRFQYEKMDALNKQESYKELLGTNLIVLLTSQPSIDKDIASLKKNINGFSRYSRFNVMVLLYDEDLEKLTAMEEKAKEQLSDELKVEKLATLRFSKICLHLTQNKQRIKQIQHPYNLQMLVLAFIIHDLEDQIKCCKVIKPDIPQEAYNLCEILNYSKSDLDPVLLQNEYKQIQCQETYYKKFFSDLDEDKHQEIQDELALNEFQVLNFWITVLKQMIKPVVQCLKDSIEFIILNGDKVKAKVAINEVMIGLNQVERIMDTKLFNYPLEQDQRYKIKHVQFFLQERLKELCSSDQQQRVLDKIDYLYRYQSMPPLSKNRRFFKGANLFQIIYRPLFDGISTELYSLFKPEKYISYQDLDFDLLKAQLSERNHSNTQTFLRLKNEFPSDFGDKLNLQGFNFNQTKILQLPVNYRAKPEKYKTFKSIVTEISPIEQEKRLHEIREGIELHQIMVEIELNQQEQVDQYFEDIYDMDDLRVHKRQRTFFGDFSGYDHAIVDEQQKQEAIDYELIQEENDRFLSEMKNSLNDLTTIESSFAEQPRANNRRRAVLF